MANQAFFSRKPLLAALRLLLLSASLSMSAAYADDYADVSRLMKANQFPEALAKAEQYLASKPRDPQMRFLKGVIQTETGKATDAIATFTKITEDYPELPEPYNNMAVLYAGQNQFDKARAALEMAIRTNPSYATAHENLGDVYARLASQAYSKALQLDGGNAGVQPKLALIRTLFSADTKGAQKPVASPVVIPTPAPAPVAAKPAPAPVVAAAPAAKPVPPTPAPVAAAPTSKPSPVPAAAVVAAAPAKPAATPAPVGAAAGSEKEVEASVRAWADAWADKNMTTYFASYGPSFDPPGKQIRKSWEEDRRARIVGKSRISVKLSNLTVSVQGNKATAKFKQDYSADALQVSSRKTLELAKTGERWVIVKESTGS
jgi:tetratricopeptide (TPR) repeat protein